MRRLSRGKVKLQAKQESVLSPAFTNLSSGKIKQLKEIRMDNRLVLQEMFKNNGLSASEMERVVNAFARVEFKKNDYLLREGQLANEYHLIESGFMRSFAIDTKGNEVTTGFYSAKKLVLEVASFFLRLPTKEHIQVVSDSVCWRISFDTFQALFHSIPAFRELSRGRLVNGYFALKKRTLSIITDSAETRYLQLLKEHPEVFQHVPLKHIASYLGVTDTSLSRIRKELTTK